MTNMRTIKFTQNKFFKWRYEIHQDDKRVAISSNYKFIAEARACYKELYGRAPKHSEEIPYKDPLKNNW